MDDVITRLSNGETIRNESFKFYTKSGDAKFLLMDSTVSWDQQGKFARSECVIRDDTDRRIQQAVDEAEISKLSMVSAAKDKFIRRIFHEIRTPLHFIYSSLNSNTLDSEVEKAKSSILTEYHEDLRNQVSGNGSNVAAKRYSLMMVIVCVCTTVDGSMSRSCRGSRLRNHARK